MGTTDLPFIQYHHIPVHPHACGDNELPICAPPCQVRFTPTRVGTTSGTMGDNGWYTGSPPRVWGQQARALRMLDDVAVHPHACGDNVFERLARAGGRRFTPTRVGTTPTR